MSKGVRCDKVLVTYERVSTKSNLTIIYRIVRGEGRKGTMFGSDGTIDSFLISYSLLLYVPGVQPMLITQGCLGTVV